MRSGPCGHVRRVALSIANANFVCSHTDVLTCGARDLRLCGAAARLLLRRELPHLHRRRVLRDLHWHVRPVWSPVLCRWTFCALACARGLVYQTSDTRACLIPTRLFGAAQSTPACHARRGTRRVLAMSAWTSSPRPATLCVASSSSPRLALRATLALSGRRRLRCSSCACSGGRAARLVSSHGCAERLASPSG